MLTEFLFQNSGFWSTEMKIILDRENFRLEHKKLLTKHEKITFISTRQDATQAT